MEMLGTIETLAVMGGLLGAMGVFLLFWFSGPMSVARASRLQEQASRATMRGDAEKARVLLIQAIEVCERAGIENPNLAPILANLAGLHAAAGNTGDAESLCRRALAICEKEPDHAQTKAILPDILNNLTDLLRAGGREAEATKFENRAKAVHDAKMSRGPTKPGIDNAQAIRAESDRKAQIDKLLEQAHLFSDTGKHVEADALVRQALRLQEAAQHPDDPKMVAILSELGRISTASGKFDEATAHYTHALHICEAQRNPDGIELAAVLVELADLHVRLDQTHLAEPALLRAIALLDDSAGLDRPELAEPLNRLAELRTGQRKFSEALEHLTRAEAILHRSETAGTPELAINLKLQATVLSELGRDADAARVKAQIESAVSGILAK